MGFFDVINGQTNGDQSLWNQYADALMGKQDADITLFNQIGAPAAPNVSVNTSSGNLTGNYKYAIAFVTGYWEGPEGTGTFHEKGNTGGGTASTTVSPNSEQIDLSSIHTGPQGVYQRIIYRTKANGSTFYYLDTLDDNTSTTYTDNVSDASLGSEMPASNNTGGSFNGDGSGLFNLPVVAKILASYDLNNLINSGQFYVTNPTNAPSTNNGYVTSIVNPDDNSYAFQQFTDDTDDNVSYRFKAAGTWSKWLELVNNDSLASQTTTLTQPLNVLTTDQVSKMKPTSFYGNTDVNYAGKDGNCEDVSKWNVLTNATVTLDNSSYSVGNNSIKITTSANGDGSAVTSNAYHVDNSKYYIVLFDLKNGNATNIYGVINKGSDGTTLIKGTNVVTESSKFSTVYEVLSPTDLGTETSIKAKVYITSPTAGQYGNFDGVRIYEIPSTVATNITNGVYTDAQIENMYPYVDSVQHVMGAYVKSYGKNLAGTGSEYTIGSTTSTRTTDALAGQTYTLSKGGTSTTTIAFLDNTGTALTGELTGTQTAPSNTTQVRITTNLITTQDIDAEQIQLELGSTATAYTTPNPSYIYAYQDSNKNPILLAGMNGISDELKPNTDGTYSKLKRFESNMALDGSLPWAFLSDQTGFKYIQVANSNFSNPPAKWDDAGIATMVKYDGSIMQQGNGSADKFYGSGTLYISIADTDSGWGDSYTPTAAEIQAYFYKWQMNDGTYGTPYNGTGTKTWIPLGDTDNTNAVTTVPTSDSSSSYDHYSLTYQLSNAVTESVTVEGSTDLFDGDNQVGIGSGVIVREQVHPGLVGSNYQINETDVATSRLTYDVESFIAVYKNGQIDNGWKFATDLAYGNYRAYIPQADYDPNASYSVTYTVLDKYKLTSSENEVDITYNKNIKTVVDENVDSIKNAETNITVLQNEKANRQQMDWIEPILLNGWVNYGGGFSTIAYFKDEMGIVHLKGMIKSGTTTSGTSLFNMPNGYKPKESLYLTAECNDSSGNSSCSVEAATSGTILIATAAKNGWLSLDGLSYRAEQ